MKLIIIFLILSFSLQANNYIIKFKKFIPETIEKYRKQYNLKKYFTLSNEKLLQLKERGEKLSQDTLSDLRTYYKGNLNQKQVKALRNDKNTELLYKDLKTIPRPIAFDIYPPTPNYENEQGYIENFVGKNGFGAKYAWLFRGGKGENVTVVDIEGGWNTNHEDLGINDPYIYDENGRNLSGTPMLDDHDNNHGTAVLGEIAAAKNEYGITGIAYRTNIKVINDYSKEYGYSTADAIIRGISVLPEGSIILLESQKGGPRYHYDETNPMQQFGLVPDEWLQAEFDAIKTATANGFVIIEAGANGEQNLDDEIYHTCKGDINTYFSDMSGHEPCFDIDTRDSGAIIVGAGNPPSGNYGEPLRKMYYSSHGKRIDVQAWGFEIYSTGYGDLFHPGQDDNQAYTEQFGGTSGASPVITAVAAVLQSRYIQKNGNFLTSRQIRDILKAPEHSHSYPGSDIGSQPDLELIFKKYLNDNYTCSEICKDWEECIQEEGICSPIEGRCNTSNDCPDDLDCDNKHFCVNPCEIIKCNNWERCDSNSRKCLLKNGRCNTNNDCLQNESCNPVTHKCLDYCNYLTCPEHSSCQRFDNNSYAECICDKHYLMDNDENCNYVKPEVRKARESCSFGQTTKPFYFILFIIFILLLRKKKRCENKFF